jgi:hypothetical protein
MKSEIIFDRGRLTFSKPAKLWSNHVRLKVEIPDDELVLSPQASSAPHASNTHDRLNAILGSWRWHDDASGSADYRTLWLSHLEDKYLAKH